MRTLNLTETALYIGVKKRTFYNLLNSKRFPVDPLPGLSPRRWSVDALDEWLKGNKA